MIKRNAQRADAADPLKLLADCGRQLRKVLVQHPCACGHSRGSVLAVLHLLSGETNEGVELSQIHGLLLYGFECASQIVGEKFEQELLKLREDDHPNAADAPWPALTLARQRLAEVLFPTAANSSLEFLSVTTMSALAGDAATSQSQLLEAWSNIQRVLRSLEMEDYELKVEVDESCQGFLQELFIAQDVALPWADLSRRLRRQQVSRDGLMQHDAMLGELPERPARPPFEERFGTAPRLKEAIAKETGIQPKCQQLLHGRNILADCLAKSAPLLSLKKGFRCDPEHLKWERRRTQFKQELEAYQPDLFGLCEVDRFEDLQADFAQLGFQGTFKRKRSPAKDGVAAFWRRGTLDEGLRRSIFLEYGRQRTKAAQVALLQRLWPPDRRHGKGLVLCTAHLRASADEGFRMQQASELVTAVTDFARQDEQIILADVNSNSTEGEQRFTDASTVYAYFKACGFRCAYQTIADQHGFQGSFPAYTTWAGWASGDYMATCDHIFISKGIEVSSVLNVPEVEDVKAFPERLPSEAYPSDHMSFGLCGPCVELNLVHRSHAQASSLGHLRRSGRPKRLLTQATRDGIALDKELVLAAVQRDPECLEVVDELWRADHDVLLECVSHDGLMLQLASEKLRDDRTIVSRAVQQDADALQYASEALRKASSIVLQAARGKPGSFEFAAEELKDDKGLLLEILALEGRLLKFASERLQADEEVVLQAVRHAGEALQWAAPVLRGSQRVAVDALAQNVEDGWSALDKFEREAAVLRRVRHPAVPRFYGSILRDLPNGRDLGLVSALVRGGTLEEEVKSGRWVATPPNLRRLAETLLEVCVHLASFAPPVVHRDIKPANVLLEVNSSDSEPNVYLVDFGSAVLGSGTKTAAGTFGYMAPESFGNTFTPKSDLYGVGATLLFAATGLEPGTLPVDRLQVQFDKALVGTVWERQETWLPNLLERLLAPAPEDRFSSAAEALAALKNGGRPRLVAPTSAVARTGRRSVGLASLEPPRGSKITVKREAENRPRAVGGVGGYRVLVEDLHYGGLMDGDWAQAGELRILFPPPLLSLELGTFSVAWTSFTAFWTAGVVSAGAPIMALFSLPFWQVGFTMLKDTFQPLLRGALELRISPSRWSVRKVNGKILDEGKTAKLQYSIEGPQMGQNYLVLSEGIQAPLKQGGLTDMEAEWLEALIAQYVQRESDISFDSDLE
ncbi:Nocturnin (Carbon catabolite repression 4-like protein) [Durusdinium trenchii]|uniref:non-specific serine/threonine protein kinase n=1 Tax=Durusdinium trenchii TaxID=1381693 RepID=A0ABP0QAB2_9DINO